MKKLSLLGITALSVLVLGACSSNNSDTKESSTETANTAQTSESNSESANSSVAKELETKFNTDGNKTVEVTTEKDVVDDQSETPHEVIVVKVVDDTTRKNMIAISDAQSTDSLTDEQKMTLLGIQQIVADAARNLNSINDSVQFTYLDNENNNMILAYSTKTADVIPLVEIGIE